MLSLSPRLKTAARFVRPGHRVIDVGTDHGYLPAYLILSGVIESAAACDIGTGPLKNAEKTAEKYDIADKIKLVLSDGLEGVSRDDGDDIVIAGMGGELIVSILKKCGWIKDGDIRLILQPMTHAEDVRRFLYDNGFYIKEEAAVRDGGKYYTVIYAQYGEGHTADEVHIQFGFLPGGEEADALRLRQRKKIENKLAGARISGREKDADYYAGLLEQFESISNWQLEISN